MAQKLGLTTTSAPAENFPMPTELPIIKPLAEPCDTCPASGLDRKQKRAIIRATIKQHPTDSARKLAKRLKWLGVNDKTITKHRDRMIATAEIPQSSEVMGGDGRHYRLKRRGVTMPQTADPVYSCLRGNNDELMREVARLYFRPGDAIADVTYGGGSMWSLIDTKQYKFCPSDLIHPDNPYDFTCLPYKDESFDVAIFDPPYVTRGREEGKKGETYGGWLNRLYKVKLGPKRIDSYSDIQELFQEGLEECYRITKPGGLCLVKCCDEVVADTNRFSHIEVYNKALDVGFLSRDLFLLHRITPPVSYGRQRFARKNHSFLWLFEKV